MTAIDDLRDAWQRLSPEMQSAFAAQIQAVAAQAGATTVPIADAGWPRIVDCAALSGLDKSIVGRAADSGAIADNGKSGPDRRLCPKSFLRWNLARIQGGGCTPARNREVAEPVSPARAKVELFRAQLDRDFEQNPETAMRGRCGGD